MLSCKVFPSLVLTDSSLSVSPFSVSLSPDLLSFLDGFDYVSDPGLVVREAVNCFQSPC